METTPKKLGRPRLHEHVLSNAQRQSRFRAKRRAQLRQQAQQDPTPAVLGTP